MSSWKLLTLAIVFQHHTPEITLKDVMIEEWLRPEGETLLYRQAELSQLNRQLMRQANRALVALHQSPMTALWRRGLKARKDQYGWLVATTDCFASPGATIAHGQSPPPAYVTTVRLNQPVRLFRSARIDGAEWDEIATADVKGWVPSVAVARISANEARQLATPRHRLTVIAPEVILPPDIRLPMGTPLHLLAVNRRRGYYIVRLPERAGDGMLRWREVRLNADLVGTDVNRHQLYPGLVPFTRNNWVRLGFRFVGIPWALGGSLPGHVDCSGLIAGLADAIGLTGMARHSGIQGRQGSSLWTRSDPTERMSTFLAGSRPAPFLLAKEGHVAVYLGERRGAHWILHAVKDFGTIISTLDLKDLDHTFTTATAF